MSDSLNNNSELDEYGVWVKNSQKEGETPLENESVDDSLPDFSFLDKVAEADAGLGSTEDSSTEVPASEGGETEISLDDFMEGGFSELEDPVPAPAGNAASEPAPEGGETEISLDDFMEGGFSDGDSPAPTAAAPSASGDEEISLDDFIDGGFETAPAEEVQTAAEDEEQEPLDIDLSFDSAPAFEEESADDDSNLDSFLTDSASPAAASGDVPASDDSGSESIDLSDFGFEDTGTSSAADIPEEQAAPKKEEKTEYDMSVSIDDDEQTLSAAQVSDDDEGDEISVETTIDEEKQAVPESSSGESFGAPDDDFDLDSILSDVDFGDGAAGEKAETPSASEGNQEQEESFMEEPVLDEPSIEEPVTDDVQPGNNEEITFDDIDVPVSGSVPEEEFPAEETVVDEPVIEESTDENDSSSLGEISLGDFGFEESVAEENVSEPVLDDAPETEINIPVSDEAEAAPVVEETGVRIKEISEDNPVEELSMNAPEFEASSDETVEEVNFDNAELPQDEDKVEEVNFETSGSPVFQEDTVEEVNFGTEENAEAGADETVSFEDYAGVNDSSEETGDDLDFSTEFDTSDEPEFSSPQTEEPAESEEENAAEEILVNPDSDFADSVSEDDDLLTTDGQAEEIPLEATFSAAPQGITEEVPDTFDEEAASLEKEAPQNMETDEKDVYSVFIKDEPEQPEQDIVQTVEIPAPESPSEKLIVAENVPESARDGDGMTAELLKEISSQIASLKSEIANLKTDFENLRNTRETDDDFELPKAAEQTDNGGFFNDSDDDDTIALSGDELNNILNTAELTPQDEDTGLDFDSETFQEPELETQVPPPSAVFQDEPEPQNNDILVESSSSDLMEANVSTEGEAQAEEIQEAETVSDEGVPSPTLESLSKPIDLFNEEKPEDSLTDENIDYLNAPVEAAEEDEDEELEKGISEDPVENVFNKWDAGNAEESVDSIPEPAFNEVSPAAAEVSAPSSDSSISEGMKDEIKSVLTYMDQLLESLPEEKIAEFAQSEQFETYKKLFKELGLA